MKAFIVSSPYQVLNSLQLCYPYKKEADIFVLDQFADCLLLVDSLQESEIFDRVIRVKNMTPKTRGRIEEFVNRNFLYSFKVAEIVGSCVYDQAYFAAMDITVYMLMKYMKKCNPKLVICQMEDGSGDYVSDGFCFSSIIDTCFHNFFGGEVFLAGQESKRIRENTYLYEPRIVYNKNRCEYIKKMQNNFIYNDFFEQINRIYRFEKEELPSTRVLFFDLAENGNNIDEILETVVQLLNFSFGKEEVGIKLHPRRRNNIYCQNIIWGKGNIPAEIYFANMKDDLSKKIIVGTFSTTIFTPKIIFDAEPYVISIHKIWYEQKCDISFKEDIFRREKTMEKLDDLYREKGKIFIPANMLQLEEILQYLIEKE